VLQLSACSRIASIAGAPSLFANQGAVQKFDFEQDTLHELPDGFDAPLGRWAVADSPNAASGTQVLVRGGDNAAVLAVKEAGGASSASGEVAVRVFLGSSGAGFSCARGAEPGHLLKIEPSLGRIGLYRKSADAPTLVDQAKISVTKGEWVHLGIRCDKDRVIGYLDGKPIVRDRATVPGFDLALYADPGVTAQFDDLAYSVTR
jgi:hypothetical protein